MRIDFVTVAAQVVNFLLLVWLLKRFLYGRVIEAMRRREQRIAQTLEEARRHKDDAEKESRTYHERVLEIDDQREQLLADARKAAETERTRLYQALHADVEERQKQWHRQLETQRGDFLDQLRRHSVDYAVSLARRALRDLGDAKLEEQIARAFVRRLEELESGERHKLAQACRDAGMRMVLRSRFEIDAADRRLITKAIHESILESTEVIYEHDSEFVCGVELTAGGQTVQWNFESYLEDLHREMSAELEEAVNSGGASTT